MTLTSRRAFLAGGALTAGAVLLDGPGALARTPYRTASSKIPVATGGGFSLGVASGQPTPTSAVLWTRVDELERTSSLTLEVATDAQFRRVVQRQRVTATSVRDFTARRRITGLKPGTEYFYRFHTRGSDSPVGRLRTLRPADSREPLKIGVLSCQSYEAGYYTALAGLAAEPDLDLVVHLGDYVYEHHYYDGPVGRKDTTGANGDGDVQSLPEWREKYRLYKADPDLRALHAAHPMIAIWDDHEVEDNYAGAGPDSASTDPAGKENDNKTPRRVPFAERRRAGYLAHFEYLPKIRRANETKIYGRLPLGANATLFLTDQRQYRSPQPCRDQVGAPCTDGRTATNTMLGATQKAWLRDALRNDRARWKLLLSSVMMMGWDSAPSVPLNQDGWDGYAGERADVLSAAKSDGVRNLAVLTGDIHTFTCGTLTTTGRTGGTPVATEFVGGSVTSFGAAELLGPASALAPGLLATNPHLKYLNTDRRGYMVVTAKPDALTVAFRSPASIKVPTSAVSTLASFAVASGSTTVQQL